MTDDWYEALKAWQRGEYVDMIDLIAEVDLIVHGAAIY